MSITVNGSPEPLLRPSTLSEVVARHLAATGSPSTPGTPSTDAGLTGGIAVARNGAVVPRSRLDVTTVEAGDEIEIVSAVQGG